MPTLLVNAQDVLIGARTIFGEARGEPMAGKIALSWVLRNRAMRRRFAGTLAGQPGALRRICLAPWQFSCWNEGDPNRGLIAGLASLPTDDAFKRIMMGAVLGQEADDPTHGADHYHTIPAPSWAEEWPPNWAASMPETGRVGDHVFYSSSGT